MSALLDAAYLLVLLLLSPAIAWVAWRKGKYRHGLREKLFGSLKPRENDLPCVWLHAVSVGEVNLIGTIIARLESERPDLQLYITTTTHTGFELARNKYGRHTVSYCPLDFSWAVRRALRRIRPAALLLTELELWPNLIRAARRDNVAIGLVNARLSQRSYLGYRRIRSIMKPVLNHLAWAAVQNDEYAARFVDLGLAPEKIVVTGSVKYDGVETDRRHPRSNDLRQLAGIDSRHRVFLAGSTQAPEEQMALKAYKELAPCYANLRLILVPRHPERFGEVADLLDRSEMPWTRRSRTKPGEKAERILLVDTIGELGAWWALADFAFVGGSMGNRGGQNMIEPAAYGAAICFGPHTENFRDVVQQMLAQRAASIVRDQQELKHFLKRCLSDRESADQQGERARRLVLANQGAIEETVAAIYSILPECTGKITNGSAGVRSRLSAISTARPRKSA